jgi:hypothetical protein
MNYLPRLAWDQDPFHLRHHLSYDYRCEPLAPGKVKFFIAQNPPLHLKRFESWDIVFCAILFSYPTF